MKITISGEQARTFKSKSGNDVTLYPIYLHTQAPFPEKVQIFENPNLPQGTYEVPTIVRVERERPVLSFAFDKAVKA